MESNSKRSRVELNSKRSKVKFNLIAEQEHEEENKRQKKAHRNSDILPISKDTQLWKDAEVLAELTVQDHNKNIGDNPPFYYVNLKNAAVEPAANGCSIYYLNLTACIKIGPPHLFEFETASWVSSTPHPTARVSLPYFTLVADEEERRCSESVVALPTDPVPNCPTNCPLNADVETAAQFVSRNQDDFRLVKILKWCSRPSLTYIEYRLTLLAEEDGQPKIFQGVAMKGQYGQPMESAGLRYICKSNLQWPFINPTWISLSLLFQVRHHFTNSFLFLDTQPLFLSLPSITKLPQFAPSIGVKATRTKLIPFLTSTQYDVDVRVLIMIGKLLGTFIPYIGGLAHAPCLLPSLEILCSVSHPHVRQEAVNSLSLIGLEMDESDVPQLFTPLIERLASGSCSSKAASLGLVDVVFPLLTCTEQKTMMNLYSKLADEEELLVRGSAAKNLVGFADSMKSPHLEDIISIFKKLTSEGQDKSVRISAVIGCDIFLRHLEPQYSEQHILPILLRLCKDTFEPIRRIAANELRDLSENQVQELI